LGHVVEGSELRVWFLWRHTSHVTDILTRKR